MIYLKEKKYVPYGNLRNINLIHSLSNKNNFAKLSNGWFILLTWIQIMSRKIRIIFVFIYFCQLSTQQWWSNHTDTKI